MVVLAILAYLIIGCFSMRLIKNQLWPKQDQKYIMNRFMMVFGILGWPIILPLELIETYLVKR